MNIILTNEKTLEIACFSDVHIGHRRTPTTNILKSLDNAFKDSDFNDLDIIFIAGDFYDRLLDLPNNDALLADMWISTFIKKCSKHNVILRVLEGTPSHDRKQPQRFISIAEMTKTDIDIKYMDALSIEYIDSLDINVLYIPDEWNSPEETLKEVKSLLNSKGLTKVDFAVMHGQFEYQLPSHIKNIPRHSSEEYLKLVKYLIFIGHIHVFSEYKRIIAPGSIDRLSHNEEGPKGHIRVSIDKKGIYKAKFIENELATIYKTIDISNYEISKSLSIVSSIIEEVPNYSYVRIKGNRDHPIFSNIQELSKNYPLINISTNIIKDDEVSEILDISEIPDYVPLIINKDNIEELLLSKIDVINKDSYITAIKECI